MWLDGITDLAVIPSSVRDEISHLLDEKNNAVSTYISDSWNFIGKQTKPRSPERKDFNDEQRSKVEEMLSDYEMRIRKAITDAGVPIEEIISASSLWTFQKRRSNAKRRFFEKMCIIARDLLSEIALRENKDVVVFEGGTGTSRLRKFIDKGGILHSVNFDVLKATGLPREGEERIETEDGSMIVPIKDSDRG